MNKLTNTAKKLDTFFKIVDILLSILCVAAIVCLILVGAVYLLKLDPEMIGTGHSSFDIGFLELEIAPEYFPSRQTILLQVALELAMGFVSAFLGRISVKYIREILEPMTQNQPFTGIVSGNLKKLAKLSIVLGVIVNLIQIVDQAMLVFALDLPALLISDKVTHISGNFVFDLTFLLVAAVFLLMSYVFRYGEELQQLSDETL